MHNRDWSQVSHAAMQQIRKGAFLTVRHGGRLNTMTIGWAQIGIIWSRPIFTVAVRDTRHTFGIIEHAPDFTVTVPLDDRFEEALKICGTKSGRDIDKFEVCGLEARDGVEAESPIIAGKGLHFEARIVCRSALDPERMDERMVQEVYPKRDFHTLYFGQILACYETD